MSTRFQLLLDGSKYADVAAMHAIQLANRYDAKIVPTEVIDTRWFNTPNAIENAKVVLKQSLERIDIVASDMGVVIEDVRTVVANPTKDILKETNSIKPSVLITGVKGNTAPGLGFNGFAGKLLNLTKCNVLLVRDWMANNGKYNNILVSTNSIGDVSNFAAGFAEKYNASLTACHCVDMEQSMSEERIVYLPEAGSSTNGDRPMLGERVKTSPTLLHRMKQRSIERGYAVANSVVDVAREHGVEATAMVRTGKTFSEIPKLTAEKPFDLMIMEQKHRNAISRFVMGTPAEQLARMVPCSVFAVKKTV
ncbi:MAG: universal stress protein [Methanosarcinaceae archaeon]|nr:universal stress protein [Methanosarcinaceae archaeon]